MVRLRITEKTERKDFIESLEKRLQSLGLALLDDATLATKGDRVSIPDIVIVESKKMTKTTEHYLIEPGGVVAVIETKNPKKDAYLGSYQALKYMSQCGGRIAFSTNFVEVVTFRVVDSQTNVDERSFAASGTNAITELADYVVAVISDRVSLTSIEVNDSFIIKMLKGAVEEIQTFTAALNPKLLEEPLGMFFAKTLNYEIEKEEKYRLDLENATKRAAAFLMVNQIVFYRVLSSENSRFPDIQSVESPFELQWYFDQVLNQDYKPVFGAKVAPLLPSTSTDAIDRIVNATKYMNLTRIKHDLLGKIFHSLPPEDIRKRIAAYYTSNSAAQLLAHLSVRREDDLVIDPACGSGTLLVAAYRRKRLLYRKADRITHRLLLSQIYGIDIALFAAHLAAINLSLQEPLYYTDEVQIIVSDSLKVNPGGYVDFQAWARQVATANTQETREGNIPQLDLVIMNPPFTNPRRMDIEYLNFIEWFLKTAHKEKYMGGWRGLHVVFLLHAEDFLKENGRIAAVLPASTFYGEYTEGVRRYFVQGWDINCIISSDVETTFSEQSDFKEVLFLATRETHPREEFQSKLIALKVPLTLENSENIAYKIEAVNSDFEDEEVRIRTVRRDTLRRSKNWMEYLEPKKLTDLMTKLKDSGQLVPGRALFKGRFIRGLEIRGPKFFFIPNQFWRIKSIKTDEVEIENKGSATSLVIPRRFLIRSLRQPEVHNGQVTPASEYYLLSVPDGTKLTEDLVRYVTWGRKAQETGLAKIPALKLGDRWYSYVAQQVKTKGAFGRVAVMKKFMPTTRGVFAHYLVGDERTWGPNLYYFLSVGSEKEDKLLTAYLNSTLCMAFYLLMKRPVGKASEEVTEDILFNLPCLNVKRMKNADQEPILDALEKLRKIELPPISKQIGSEYRRELDQSILAAMGVTDIQGIIDQLYSLVDDRLRAQAQRQHN